MNKDGAILLSLLAVITYTTYLWFSEFFKDCWGMIQVIIK